MRRRLLKRFQHNCVEVAAQHPRQPFRGRGPLARLRVIARRLARTDHIRRNDGIFQAAQRIPLQPVRLVAREQFIENYAERIYVAGRGDRLAHDLLRARVGRSKRPAANPGKLRLRRFAPEV